MADIEILEQKPVALVNVKEKLAEHKKKFKELNFRAGKVYEYVNEFVTLTGKQAGEKQKKLSETVSRLRDKHIVKILDLMPEDANSLKIIFAGEAVSLKPEEQKQITDIVNE